MGKLMTFQNGISNNGSIITGPILFRSIIPCRDIKISTRDSLLL